MKNLLLFILFTIIIISGCTGKQEEVYGIAENFSLPDVNNLEQSLSDYKADLIMVHFWADWCAHCREEFKGLEKTYQALKPEGFLIVAVNVGQSEDHVKGIQDEYHITFPMLRDTDKKVSELYKVKGLPASYFLGSDGQIKYQRTGWIKAEEIAERFYALK